MLPGCSLEDVGNGVPRRMFASLGETPGDKTRLTGLLRFLFCSVRWPAMTDAERYLATMTLRTWLAQSPADRAVATDALMETMPADFTLGSLLGHEGGLLPFFVHQPTMLGFTLLWGDRFVMGATPELVAATQAAWEHGPTGDEWEIDQWAYEREEALEALTAQVPPRVVDVGPFLLSESALTTAWANRFGLAEVRAGPEFNVKALEALRHLGWRLPSEAELAFATQCGALASGN